MEKISRKILLENSIDRGYNSPTYGQITASTFYVNVKLTQNIDDMGMFTDINFIPNYLNNYTPVDYTILKDKLASSGITFPFMTGILPISANTAVNDLLRVTGTVLSDYYRYSDVITGTTDSRIEDVKSYNTSTPYRVGFDVNTETYVNYSGGTIDGVDRVTALGNPNVYVFSTDKNDVNIGTNKQGSGLLYEDYTGKTIYSVLTYIGEGINQTNSSLSALTKEEYLFGIISKPEVKSDIFIDRGIATIYERHLKLSEITNLGELFRYGNKFYNLTR